MRSKRVSRDAKNGALVQNNFDDYPVLRIHQTPKNISVTILSDPTKPPTGIGEVGVPTVAPALANAIYAAGFGKRLRSIPFCREITVL